MEITPEIVATLPPLPEGWEYAIPSDGPKHYLWIDSVNGWRSMCLDSNAGITWRVESGLEQRAWNVPFAGLEGFATLHDAAHAAGVFLTLRGGEHPWPNES